MSKKEIVANIVSLFLELSKENESSIEKLENRIQRNERKIEMLERENNLLIQNFATEEEYTASLEKRIKALEKKNLNNIV